jgi:hypothetical protein
VESPSRNENLGDNWPVEKCAADCPHCHCHSRDNKSYCLANRCSSRLSYGTVLMVLRFSGRSRRGSNGITSHRASHSRMPLSRASMADCATSCSTRHCSRRSPMCARLWRSGRMITIPSGRTARSAICRQPFTPRSALPECNGTGRCATSRAPRSVPLHHRANRVQMKPGLSS